MFDYPIRYGTKRLKYLKLWAETITQKSSWTIALKKNTFKEAHIHPVGLEP
jgi:hypothetical protein